MSCRRLPVLLLLLLSSAFVAAGCGQIGKVYTGSEDGRGGGGGDGEFRRLTDAPFDEAARKAAGCDEVVEKENLERGHTERDGQNVDYAENPPMGGEHNPTPLDWGVYDTDIADERVVHNLEHGHIVVFYKGISDGEVEDILDARDTAIWHIVVAPRKANPKDGVYFQTWGASLYCKEFSEVAMQHMIDEYRDKGPEFVTGDARKAD